MEENKIISEDVKSQEVSNLSEEQWSLAFNHPRFKELNQKAKELEKIKSELEKQEAERLKEKEDWKTLAEKRELEINELKNSVQNQAKRQAIISQAVSLGVRKEAIDDVIRLVDLNTLQFENDKVINADSVVKELLFNKPYLMAEAEKKTFGTPNVSDNGAKSQFWKWSEIEKNSRDFKWYQANKEEIEKAKKEGRINYRE
jgi:hypothetical protein